MIATLFLIFVVLSTLIALTNWRAGLLLAHVVALMQDPVRKCVENRPGYYVLCVLPVIAATCVSLLRSSPYPTRLFHDYPSLRHACFPLALALALSSVVTIANFGIGVMPAIPLGLLSYAAPLFFLIAGYHVLRRPEDLMRCLSVAGFLSGLSLIGVLFEYEGFEWEVLGTITRSDWIHHFGYGRMVNMICGFFRSPENMGWHAATATMIAISMLIRRRSLPSAVLWLAIGSLGIVGCLLSGRRKMLFMVLTYVVTLGACYVLARRSQRGLPILLVTALILAGSVLTVQWIEVKQSYVDLAMTTLQSAPGRLETSSYGSFSYTLDQAGFFGYGLGTMAQGIEHLGIKLPFKRWQEGGTNKILAELGVPGAVAVTILFLVLLSCCWQATRRVLREPDKASQAFNLLAMLTANAGCFMAAQQLYGDPYVLFFVSLLFAGLLSVWRLEKRHVHRRTQQAQDQLTATSVATREVLPVA